MDKREAIKALETQLNVEAVYLGTPSFAYAIRTEKAAYIIDRAGTMRDLEGNANAVEAILAEDKIALLELADGYEMVYSLGGYTGITLKNIVNMPTSKEKLIMKALKALLQIFI